jgi:hypothetical protein
MARATISEEKLTELRSLLSMYKKEVCALHGVSHAWKKLSTKARDVCAKDFDEAIIAREELLEELFKYKNLDLKTVLNEVDELLLDRAKMVMDIYRFDVKSYLNEMKKKLSP